MLYQGGLTLLAGQAQEFLMPPMVAEMTAAGGLLILAIGIGPLLELRKIRVAGSLPALATAPLIAALLHALGVNGF